ncbi:MAG: hypothetical protein R2769_13450 [Saprospiraceae bacterium]
MRGPGNKLYAFIGLGCMISHDQGNTCKLFYIENKGVVDLIFDPSGYTYAITANNRFYLLPLTLKPGEDIHHIILALVGIKIPEFYVEKQENWFIPGIREPTFLMTMEPIGQK